MKIYTKTGDEGKTGLIGGTRVAKSDMRIEAYGTVDELNSHIGLLLSYEHTAENKEFLLNHTDASFLTDSVMGGVYRMDERGYPESDDSMRRENSVLSLLSKELASYTPEAAVSTCGIDAEIFLAVSEKVSMCNGKTKFLSSKLRCIQE